MGPAKETVHLREVLNSDDEAVQRAFQLEQEVTKWSRIQYLLDVNNPLATSNLK